MQDSEQNGSQNAPKEPSEAQYSGGFRAEEEVGMQEAERRQQRNQEARLLIGGEQMANKARLLIGGEHNPESVKLRFIGF